MENQSKKHKVLLFQREKLEIDSIEEVISFDEGEIELLCSMGRLQITGSGLHVEKISLEEGTITVTGKIDSLYYPDEHTTERRGFFSRFLK